MPAPKAACVIGWPVGHSRSPLIHNYWIKQHGLDAEYRREAVAPEQFEDFIAHLAARGYVGANVTVPHKEAALALSEPDDRARAVGAANTLWLDGGRLRSTNTDVEGFIGNLDATAPGWDRGLQCALVLGLEGPRGRWCLASSSAASGASFWSTERRARGRAADAVRRPGGGRALGAISTG